VPDIFVVAKSRVSIPRIFPLGPLRVVFAELAAASGAAREGRAVFFGAALRAGFLKPFGGRFFGTEHLLVSDDARPHPNGRRIDVQGACRRYATCIVERLSFQIPSQGEGNVE
jgi:hypothetical protein